MTTRITINVDAPSKAEEIEIIEKLHAAFKGSDTYLASLFTDDFLGWVSNQIKNDFPPDVYGFGINASTFLEVKIKSLKKEKTQNQFDKVELKKELSLKKEQIDNLDKIIGSRDERMIADSEEKTQLEEKIDKLQMENVTLKVKLYDLITKEG